MRRLAICGAFFTRLAAAPAMAADPSPDEIDAIFSGARRPGVPGCVVGVVRNGEFFYKQAYGLADLERNVPLTTKSSFYIASAAKQFTAAVVAHLVREQRLSLDDSLRKYVPELPDYADTITIRHLIHHTSGLRDYPTLQAMAGTSGDLTEGQFIRLMSRQQQLNFAPGSQHLYSNSGYVMLAIVVRRVTGKGLREYSEEALFHPLGMVDTRYQDNRTQLIPNRAIAYSPIGQTFRIDGDTVDDSLPPSEPATVGDGWLFTTIEDFLGWARHLEDPLSKDLLQAGMLNDGTRLDYAFGLVHVKTPGGIPFLAHGGNRGGYRVGIVHFPEEKLTVGVFCNNGGLSAQDFTLKVSALFLPPVPPPPATRTTSTPSQSAPPAALPLLPREELREYAGRYYSSELEAAYELAVSDGALRFLGRSIDVQMRPIGKDTFGWSSWTIEFQRDDSGRVSGYMLNGIRARGLRFNRSND